MITRKKAHQARIEVRTSLSGTNDMKFPGTNGVFIEKPNVLPGPTINGTMTPTSADTIVAGSLNEEKKDGSEVVSDIEEVSPLLLDYLK